MAHVKDVETWHLVAFLVAATGALWWHVRLARRADHVANAILRSPIERAIFGWNAAAAPAKVERWVRRRAWFGVVVQSALICFLLYRLVFGLH